MADDSILRLKLLAEEGQAIVEHEGNGANNGENPSLLVNSHTAEAPFGRTFLCGEPGRVAG